MSLLDRQMLPERSRTMEQLAEVLQSEQQELDLMTNTLRQKINELTVCTAKEELSRYERIFGLPVQPALPTEERRRRIIAKRNARYPCTAAFLEDTVSRLTGLRVSIRENFAAYTFLVTVHLNNRYELDLPAVYARISELRPAHLAFSVQSVAQTVIERAVNVAVVVREIRRYHILVQWPVAQKQKIQAVHHEKIAVQSRMSYEIEVH